MGNSPNYPNPFSGASNKSTFASSSENPSSQTHRLTVAVDLFQYWVPENFLVVIGGLEVQGINQCFYVCVPC